MLPKLFKNERFRLMILITCFIFAILTMIYSPLNLKIILAQDNVVNTNPVQIIEQTQTNKEASVDNLLPSVSVEQVSTIVSNKLYDLVYMAQTIVKPLAILFGVFCIGRAFLGAFGDSSLLYQGLIGLFICVICYYGVTYAPEIIEFLNGWVAEGTESIVGEIKPF